MVARRAVVAAASSRNPPWLTRVEPRTGARAATRHRHHQKLSLSLESCIKCNRWMWTTRMAWILEATIGSKSCYGFQVLHGKNVMP